MAEGADPLDTGTSILGDTDPADTGAAKDEGAADGDSDGSSDEGTKEGDEPALIGAPEGDYDLAEFLEDGQTIDTEALKEITPLAKEIGLSNAGLAKLAQTAQPILAKQFAEGMAGEVMAVRTGWDTDTRAAISGGVNTDGVQVAADPVFEGRSFDEVTRTAAKALDAACGDKLFPGAKADGSPGTFRDFLKTTGLGNHPAMTQFAYWAGSRISEEEDLPRGGGGGSRPLTREEKYYGPKT